jgi:hypothetical protein
VVEYQKEKKTEEKKKIRSFFLYFLWLFSQEK